MVVILFIFGGRSNGVKVYWRVVCYGGLVMENQYKSLRIIGYQLCRKKISKPEFPWANVSAVNSLINDGEFDVELITSNVNPYVAWEIIKFSLPVSRMRTLYFGGSKRRENTR